MFGILILYICRIVIIFLIGLFILIPLFRCLFKVSYDKAKKEQKKWEEVLKPNTKE